jgi:hypothetical protein
MNFFLQDVELKIIIERLVKQESCDYMQLIQYLASISDNLEENDMLILKNNPIWPKENLQPEPYTPPPTIFHASPTLPIIQRSTIRRLPPLTSTVRRPITNVQRFRISNLHVPLESNREFGLPIIDWEGWWSNSTQEGTNNYYDILYINNFNVYN